MHLGPAALSLLLGLFPFVVLGQTFNAIQDYSGSTFFDEWDFFGHWDNLTNGHVNWLNREDATRQKLAYTSTSGTAILKVDNTTLVPQGYKRDSIRIESKRKYDYGSLWIADFRHIPYGCSVWPAFWSKGDNWPLWGEIDIVEGINNMGTNQMALHSDRDKGQCLRNTADQKGRLGQPNCSTDSGCTVTEASPNSFGAGFASAGGGVFATQFDVTGIWFWGRNDIPKSIAEATSTSSIASLNDWGIPSAAYPTGSGCNLTEYFGPQTLVLDITLCGVWAGVPSLWTAQCGGQGRPNECYDVVWGDGSNYKDAYFEVNYIRAYTISGSPTTTTTTTSFTTPSGPSGGVTPSTIVVVTTVTQGPGTSTPTRAPSTAISKTHFRLWTVLGGVVLMLLCQLP